MASHRRPKQPSRTRVTVLTATAAAAVAVTTQTAQAAPAKPSLDEVKAKVDKLYDEAEHATEKYNGSKEQQQKLQKQISNLQDIVARGQGELNDLRDDLGAMATAQYRNGGIDPSIQLFLSSDPDNYLEKAATLDQLSTKQSEALEKIQDKQRSLEQKRAEARTKLDDLSETRKELAEKKEKIQGKLSEARDLLNTLTAEQRAAMAAEQARANRAAAERVNLGSDVPASQRAGAALSAAQSKIGSPYVWGATGPNSFDCSGLTSWAYSQAGVSLPRTSQSQASAGMRVSSGALQPGDLVLYYGDLHHIGLYAGNGQVLHAPKPGSSVQYAPLHSMPFMFGVRIG